jgi:hypothetical protein
MRYNSIWLSIIVTKLAELCRAVVAIYGQYITYADIIILLQELKSACKFTCNKNYQRKKRRKYVIEKERCHARCWTSQSVKGKQCSKQRVIGNLCTSHHANLAHGLYAAPITPELLAHFNSHHHRTTKADALI